MFTSVQLFIIKIVLAIALFLGFGAFCYYEGVSHQKTVYVTQQVKANEQVVQKNDKMQDASNAEAKVQIVYKDRIVTKYQTVTQEVIKYEKTPAANVFLDPEFIRLHNAAASANDEVQIAPAASGTDGADQASGISTGDAIAVISRNYQRFYECKATVEGWQRYYTNLQKTIND